MIIGKNGFKSQNITDDIKEKKYTNVLDKNDMADKSLAMLKERYSQGLISLDEL